MEPLIETVPGWAQADLGSIAEIQAGPSGARLYARDRVEDGIPLVRPRDLHDGRIFEEDVLQVAPESADQLGDYRLSAGDILCARTGDLGRHGIVLPAHEGWLFATGLLRVHPYERVHPRYLAYFLGLPAVRDWIQRHSTGTATPAISTRVLGSLQVPLPPPSTQAAIGDALTAFDEKIELHRRIARTTGRIRDSLAPLLMAGVLPAPDAEHE